MRFFFLRGFLGIFKRFFCSGFLFYHLFKHVFGLWFMVFGFYRFFLPYLCGPFGDDFFFGFWKANPSEKNNGCFQIGV